MSLPTQVIAGDSLNFLISEQSYSAVDGWSLRYVCINATDKITINSVAEGESHRFTVGTTESSSWKSGEYLVVLYAVRGSERVTVTQSALTILPDPVASATYDGRSSARKTLDNLRAAYDEMIASGGFVQMVSINGRATQFRTAEEIIKQIEFFQRQVNNEAQAKNLQNGCGLGGRILTRL